MIKFMFHLLVIVVMFLTCGQANATLFDQGNVIYDDVADRYWVKDLTLFSLQTYAQQQQTIAGLNASPDYQSSSWGTWHMADAAEIDTLNSYFLQIPYFFAQTDTSGPYFAPGSRHWWGTYDETAPYFEPDIWYKVKHLTFNEDLSVVYSGGLENYIEDDATLAHGVVTGAWVTASASSVPVPAAVWLLGSGLIGLFGLSRKLRG